MVLALPLAVLQAQNTVWHSVGIGGGGALYCPSFNPYAPDEIYAGCDMSELFHSTDAGVSWAVIPFPQIQGGHASRVEFTSDPQVRYCLDYTNDMMTPVKSLDGGNTWSVLPGDPTGGGAWYVIADPRATTKLIVCDYASLYWSTDGGSTFALKYHNPSLGGCYIAGVLFDDPNIYIGTNLGMLNSTDGGSTFNMTSFSGIPGGQGLLSFAGAKQGDTIRFFGVAADTNDIYVGITGGDYWNIAKGIYRYTLGQPGWTLRESGIRIGTDFPFFVGMSRSNTGVAYAAGSNSNGFPSIFRTTNAGDTWVQTFLTTNNQNIYTGWSGSGGDRGWGYGECPMDFQVCPSDPNRAAFGDYGFIHVTTDGGTTWHQCYVTAATQNPPGVNITPGRYYQGNGLENTSTWDICWISPESLFIGSTDINGIRSGDGGTTWSFIPNLTLNSVYRVIVHPTTGALYAAISSVHDLYQSTYLQDARIDGGNGNVKFSTDRGVSWNTLHNFARPVIWLALDPSRPYRMYAAVVNYTGGQGGIWVTNDLQNGASSVWTKLANPPRTQGHPFNIRVLDDRTLVVSYSGRRDSTGHFTASAGVFVSSDSGATWTDRSDNGMRYWMMDVVIDPHDSRQNTWYGCVFSGWGGPPNGLGGLYRTTNRGASWTRINDLDRVGACTVSPNDPNVMWLTTEIDGLWYCDNLGSGTPTFSLVTSYPFRHPERVFYSPYDSNEVWITSFGGGTRVGNLATGITERNREDGASSSEIRVPSLAAGPILECEFKLSISDRITLSITDVSGRVIAAPAAGRFSAGRHSFSLPASALPAGMYYARLRTSREVLTARLIRVR
jgi:hypothetical protein